MTLQTSLLISTAAVLCAALVQCHPQGMGSGIPDTRVPTSSRSPYAYDQIAKDYVRSSPTARDYTGPQGAVAYDNIATDYDRSSPTARDYTGPQVAVDYAESPRRGTTDNAARYDQLGSQGLRGCTTDKLYFEKGQQYNKLGECTLRVCQGDNAWLTKECGPEEVPGNKNLGWPDCCTNLYGIGSNGGNI